MARGRNQARFGGGINMNPTQGNGLDAPHIQPAKELTNNAVNFTGPFSESQRLVLQVLVSGDGMERWEVDSIGDVANGPDLIAQLRAKGLGKDHLTCVIKWRMDHFWRLKRFGEYALTPLGKQAARRALNVSKLPLAQATAKRARDGIWSLTVSTCPFCREKHQHGGGAGERPSLGSRAADCHGGQYELEVAP